MTGEREQAGAGGLDRAGAWQAEGAAAGGRERAGQVEGAAAGGLDRAGQRERAAAGGLDRAGQAERTAAGGRERAGVLDELGAAIRRAPARLGATRLVLVDGPSGAGKTTFAQALADRVGAEIVHTDDLLDGWEDQFTYWKRLVHNVFEPITRGSPATYPIYDWHEGKFASGATVAPGEILIVEGVGAAREEGRPLASLSVFVDAPLEVRLARSLRRDGPRMQAQLELWRRREALHFAADATAWCADKVIGCG